MGDNLEILNRLSLITERNKAKDILDNISDVRIHGIINTNGKLQVFSLIEQLPNFPFDFTKEIKILLADAIEQYDLFLTDKNKANNEQ